MIIRSATFAGKGFVLGVSAAAHVALLVASQAGHGAPRAGSLRPMSAEIQIEPTVEVPAPVEEEPLPNRANASATAPHHHTHPYPVPADHDLVPHDPSLVHAVSPTSPPAALPAADAPAPLAATDPLPRFVIAIDASPSVGGPFASGADPRGADIGEEPLAQGSVDTPARRLRGIAPVYPVEARQDQIEADVPLVLLVSRTGSVESVDVVRRAGHGLDEAAVDAARRFQFTPAVKNGRAVRVRVSWTMEFRLAG